MAVGQVPKNCTCYRRQATNQKLAASSPSYGPHLNSTKAGAPDTASWCFGSGSVRQPNCNGISLKCIPKRPFNNRRAARKLPNQTQATARGSDDWKNVGWGSSQWHPALILRENQSRSGYWPFSGPCVPG